MWLVVTRLPNLPIVTRLVEELMFRFWGRGGIHHEAKLAILDYLGTNGVWSREVGVHV